MINLTQLVISLFTTGGRPNPLSFLIFLGTLFLGYQVLTLKSQNYELMRQIEVVHEAAQDKAEALKEAKNEKDEAVEIINSGKFDNAYLKRLQQSD